MQQNTLMEDIATASDWVVRTLNSSGYKADYTLESMRENDRFFQEQNTPTGLLSQNRGEHPVRPGGLYRPDSHPAAGRQLADR